MRNRLLWPFATLAFAAASFLFAWLWRSSEPESQVSAAPPVTSAAEQAEPTQKPVKIEHRSPVDLALFKTEDWLATANETSGTVSLLDKKSGEVLDEIYCGEHPVAITLAPSEKYLLVSTRDDGNITWLEVQNKQLQKVATLHVGYHPHDIAFMPDESKAYVGLVATAEIAEIDLATKEVARRIEVGPWPRYLTVSPDGTRLAIGCSGSNEIAVVDTATGERLYEEPLSGGINIGHMTASADNKYAYFPWMIYRSNPIDVRNIRLGWVLASRIGRVRLDGPSYREAISLDVPGLAVADPHGIAINDKQTRLVVAASGTQELLVYRLQDLPFVGAGGPGDLIDQKLLQDKDLFYRIPLDGRPMGVTLDPDNRTAYVVNYFQDAVQVVDIEDRRVKETFKLGETAEPSLARQGAEVFYDGKHSLDQWYSCHTCHYNGGVNSKAMDTWNDGSPLTSKTVLPLYYVHDTAPWTWHGWQTDLKDAMAKSFTTTMQGKGVSPEQTEAIMAFFAEMKPAVNPFLQADGSLSPAAERGKKIFASAKANCMQCHTGPYFTDGEIHDVGLNSDRDKYEGYNTPSLLGCYAKVRYLHDGRAKSLEKVLTGPHAPSKVSGTEDFTAEELSDLIAYLRSL